MLTKYIKKAMEHARYEMLSDDGSFYGEIPECRGVYANAHTLEECRNELEEILEEWILFRIYKNLPIPEIDGLEIKIRKELAA
ncbi:MAG: type II toxin-antitoxin system HicB family antitoxin [Candidatus Omnitrophica bacterium]|nr:type II toxin-antitoxin system HicB family antitoxin [Candidatus Omnitrophota bacterium]